MSLASTALAELNNGPSKYLKALGYPAGTDWCAIFVRWCGLQNDMDFGSSAEASELLGLYGNEDLTTSSHPKVGDLAFVNPKKDIRSGVIRKSDIGHVGIITAISGDKITTVNGNWGGKVGYGYYHLNGNSYYSGYGSILRYGKNS